MSNKIKFVPLPLFPTSSRGATELREVDFRTGLVPEATGSCWYSAGSGAYSTKVCCCVLGPKPVKQVSLAGHIFSLIVSQRSGTEPRPLHHLCAAHRSSRALQIWNDRHVHVWTQRHRKLHYEVVRIFKAKRRCAMTCASCHCRSYHEIQFITIKGLEHIPSLSDVTGSRISINLTRTGSFSCSNALITRIYDTTINNYLGLTTGLTRL